MGTIPQLKPAQGLAAAKGVRFTNESEEYRRAGRGGAFAD